MKRLSETRRGKLTDAALADAIAPGHPQRMEMVAKLTPERRSTIEHMLWVASEVEAGRIPEGVIACR